MGNKGLHTGTWPGKIVRIVLKDGTRFLDRFVDRTHGKTIVEFEKRGKIKKRHIKSFTPLGDNMEAVREMERQRRKRQLANRK